MLITQYVSKFMRFAKLTYKILVIYRFSSFFLDFLMREIKYLFIYLRIFDVFLQQFTFRYLGR